MTMEPGTRTRLATVLILFLVLVTGSVLGVAVDRSLGARPVPGAAREGGSSEPAGAEDGRTEAREGDQAPSRRRLIVEEVGLTEAQKSQVDSIVAHYRQQMRELQDELQADLQAAYMPRYRGLLAETREEIKGVLNPGQRLMYDSLLVEHDRRREERRARDSVSGAGSG